MATNFAILTMMMLGCALAADEAKKENRLIDLQDLMQKKDQVLNFIQDPEDVGTLGKKSQRAIPVPGLEKLEFNLKGGGDEFDFEKWKKETKGDSESSLQSVATRNADLSQLVDYNRRYRKYGEDAKEDQLDFEVVRQGFGKAAAESFEGLLLLANSLEAHDADSDGRLTKAEFVTALRGVPADVKEERVRKAAKLDKDPEGLFELLRVDDAELVDIGAFVEGVSHSISHRKVSLTKTAQELSEASGSISKEDVLDFVETRVNNAEGEVEKAGELFDVMSENPHAKEFQKKADNVAQEAARQVAGFQASVEQGDAEALATDIATGAAKEAAKYAGAAAAAGPEIEAPEGVQVNIDKGSSIMQDLRTEYEHFKGIQDEIRKEEEEGEARERKRLQEEGETPEAEKRKPRTFKVKVNDEVYEMTGNARSFYKDVDKVMNEADVDHKTAAQALAEAEGSVEEALHDLRGENEQENDDGKEPDPNAWKAKTIENAKEAWKGLRDRAAKQQKKE